MEVLAALQDDVPEGHLVPAPALLHYCPALVPFVPPGGVGGAPPFVRLELASRCFAVEYRLLLGGIVRGTGE